MNFVTLTLLDGKHVIVNTEHITYMIERPKTGGTDIILYGSDYIVVKESLEEVEKIIRNSNHV
jgi:uncharacterized protein YlzI (FlbEa/FlbD family)